MDINLSPFVGQLCTHCPADTGDMEANNDSATDEGWEEEMYIKPRGCTEAQVTSLSLAGGGGLDPVVNPGTSLAGKGRQSRARLQGVADAVASGSLHMRCAGLYGREHGRRAQVSQGAR